MLNDVGLELVQVSRPLTTCRQINLQAETLLTLETGPLRQYRSHVSHIQSRKQQYDTTIRGA